MPDPEEPKKEQMIGCCSLFYLPVCGMKCEFYERDTGPGILMSHCSNCWWFEDRSKKYKMLSKGNVVDFTKWGQKDDK